MAPSLLALLVAALAAGGVLAGHAMWEPKLDYRGSVAVLSSAGLTSVTENATAGAHDLNKRWVAVRAGSGNADIRLWPRKTIRYCFESAATKDRLFRDLQDARNKWIRIGLPNDFGFEEVSDTECASNRANVLLIKYSPPGTGPGQSVMATTPALPPLGPGYDGPTMTLTDDETMGMLDKVANYAHELGHAWGLYHEHQNPYFWESAYGNEGGTLFGNNKFNCRNLKDYQRVQDDIETKIRDYPNDLGEVVYGSHRTDVCIKRSIAKLYKFSAYDYLPVPLNEANMMTHNGDEIDWNSIMIYPSGAGATGSAQAGGPDNRAIILQKPDGSRIPINTEPSPQDVAGLVALYGEQRQEDPPLLAEKKSSKRDKFLSIFKKSKGGSAC